MTPYRKKKKKERKKERKKKKKKTLNRPHMLSSPDTWMFQDWTITGTFILPKSWGGLKGLTPRRPKRQGQTPGKLKTKQKTRKTKTKTKKQNKTKKKTKQNKKKKTHTHPSRIDVIIHLTPPILTPYRRRKKRKEKKAKKKKKNWIDHTAFKSRYLNMVSVAALPTW